MADPTFSPQEKKKFRLKKFIKEQFSNFLIEMVINILFVIILLSLCGGENFPLGIALAVIYSVGKFLGEIRHYKKDYLDLDIQ